MQLNMREKKKCYAKQGTRPCLREHALRFSVSLIAKSALSEMRKTSSVISSKNKGGGRYL